MIIHFTEKKRDFGEKNQVIDIYTNVFEYLSEANIDGNIQRNATPLNIIFIFIIIIVVIVVDFCTKAAKGKRKGSSAEHVSYVRDKDATGE